MILTLTVTAAYCWIGPQQAVAQPQNLMDPSLTELGGLYPDGWPTRPLEFEAAVLEIAKNQIQPLDAQGNPDPQGGKIVLMSVGMSNTNIFFEGRPDLPYTAFHKRAQIDPARNRQLLIVNGAQGTRAAMDWEFVDSTTYSTMKSLLAKAGGAPPQVMHRKGEPDCYEAGFSVRWMIDKQMKGDPDLNWDPAKGPVKAPLILWGPYFWCDGLKPRSDGLI